MVIACLNPMLLILLMNEKLLIGFTGDVMIGRGVDAAISTNGYTYPWGNLLPLLSSTDLNVINLETTLTNSSSEVFKTFNFKASPDKVECLKLAHIHIANIANNHILDFSESGFYETLRTLDLAGIKYTGAGNNEIEAAKPLLSINKNIRIVIFGFTDNEPGWKAEPGKCGVNFIDIANTQDRKSALHQVETFKTQADVVIISLHWGPNLKEAPGPKHIHFAHQLVDHGATIIHGHSAHNFQGLEVYKGKLILYDTGDFVDDYVVDAELKNDHSFFYMVTMQENNIIEIKLVPVLISNCQVNYATGDDKNWCLHRIQQLSAKFGTTITNEGLVVTEKRSFANNNLNV